VALHRNLPDLGFTGTYQQVQRFLQPYRVSVSVGSWRRCAFETEPATMPVDYGQFQVWIGEPAGDGPSVRPNAGLFAALVHVWVSQ
jgi:hypothetical protein